MKPLIYKKNYFKIKTALYYLILFFLYFVFTKAGIRQTLYPFAIGLFMSLIWCKNANFLNVFLFCLASFLNGFDFSFLLVSAIFSIALLGVFIILKKKNKSINKTIYTILSSLLLLVYIPYYLYIKTPILNIFYTFVISIIFHLVICKLYKTYLTKGTNIKLNLDEIIYICFILIAIGSGLSQIEILNTSCIVPIGLFLIFLVSLCTQSSGSLVCGACLGLGHALNMNSLEYIAYLTFFALIAMIFKNNKYYSAISLILVELLLGLYFKVYGEYNVLHFVLAIIPILVILLIPNRIINSIKLLLNGSENNISRNIILRNKRQLSKKLQELSDAFFEININFRNSIKTKLTREENIELIKSELCKRVCLTCKNKEHCLGLLKEHTLDAFHSIIEVGLQKQKISILDTPSYLTSRCNKINLVVQTTNSMILSFNNFINEIDEKNNGKLLIADNLDAMSKLFYNLSKEINEPTNFDFNKEEQIAEDLNYFNIHVKDVVLTKKQDESLCLTCLASDKDIEKNDFVKSISSSLKSPMEITNISKSNIEGFNVVTLTSSAKYDCIYGISGANKFGNTVSGDNFSCVKLTRDKVLFAICDGMGNGERAKAHSTRTINLIESFYKAGFTQESIIEIVNRLITLDGEDVFSALDIAILDLSTGIVNFIKLGSQETFIKQKNKVDVLVGDSLPLGIIKDVKPFSHSRILNSGNMIFMCSDGVIDCMGFDNLLSFLESTTHENPQALCEEIVNEAIKNTNGKPKDDITALVFKILLV